VRIPKEFGRDVHGEPRVWWHWHDLRSENRGRPHGRAFLHFAYRRQVIGVEWVLLPSKWRLGVSSEFADRGDENLSGALHLLLLSLYWSVERARWVRRLPGVAWEGHTLFSGKRAGQREIGFSVDRERLWVYPWVHPDGGGRRRTVLVDWADLFLGRERYTQVVLEEGVRVEIVMPEGTYHGTASRHLATWKRPRWPWAKRLTRVEIDVPGGVPVPGKDENAWDIDDDAIFGTTVVAETIEAGVEKLIASAMRDRRRYGGGEDWRPAAQGAA